MGGLVNVLISRHSGAGVNYYGAMLRSMIVNSTTGHYSRLLCADCGRFRRIHSIGDLVFCDVAKGAGLWCDRRADRPECGHVTESSVGGSDDQCR